MHEIGFMQGRLSPKPKDRIQAFPKDSWELEFELANKLGFSCIEVIFDKLYLDLNPLASLQGRKHLLKLVKKEGVRIHAICADYFMDHSIVDPSHLEKALWLLNVACEIECPMIEFPFVDQSSLLKSKNRTEIITALQGISERAQDLNVQISIESDLPPKLFKDFFDLLPDNIGANLDLGNSAALGYDVWEECQAYGDRIVNVHIKDRIRNGTTVPLGHGDARFERAFESLSKVNYQGDFILQTCPEDDYLGTATKYRAMVKDWIKLL